MDIKKRIEEVVQNGTLQSGEEITYIETDDLYAIFDAIANSSNDIQNIRLSLPDRDKLLDEAYKNTEAVEGMTDDPIAQADFDDKVLDYILNKIYSSEA